MRRFPLLGEGDFGAGAENGDGRAQLMGGVGHETAHLIHRPLDRRRRFADQDVAAPGDEEQCRERRGPERLDQRGILVLELDAVGDDGGDVRRPGRPREPLGIDPELPAVRGIEVPVPVLGLDGLPRRVPDPYGDPRRLDGAPFLVEQVERSLGDMQLVHGIDHGSVGARTLGLTDACRLFEGGRRSAE